MNRPEDRLYVDLAEQIMFVMIKNSAQLNQYIEGKLEYRKNKAFDHVKNAIRKGLKNGMGKVQYEIDWIALYLKDVFKKAKR